MEWSAALLIMLGLCVLFLLGTVLVKPVMLLLRASFYLLAGLLLLVLVNAVLGRLGMHLAVNPATILTAGVLHVPGVILLLVLEALFV
ncbi:inhibitor of pro-sigmaK processing BofA [Desulfocucumis palustris]|uniref:Inhibitor of pro-sigmaK processing BofA n=1 Tax=Desulfocucumis palustris TaxID=1898651 RepID=A0A2L2XKE4_9FIRM|nr:pro-sigmaK processing inhibitor BofA family protein [Desulfocucumis palustris]GBF34381.1 inhibitor of pro-sigmaK processing BofA [Desulfocucumis palustris]